MAIVIKKRVTLEFLGEEYKDAYLEFKAISVGELDEMVKKTKEFQEKKDSSAVNFILGILKEKFVSGKVGEDVVNAEDLEQFDVETVMRSFRLLTGQEVEENLAKP